MIKAEVVFDGEDIIIGLWLIVHTNNFGFSYCATKNGKDLDYFYNREDAIKYCLEN